MAAGTTIAADPTGGAAGAEALTTGGFY
jgi:hypothetical protein